MDYLLGKDRQRDGAIVLQEAGRGPELIDASALRQSTPLRRLSLLNRMYRPASVKADGELRAGSDARTR